MSIKETDLLTLENGVFRAYGFCAFILIQKLVLMSMSSKFSTRRHQSGSEIKR